MFSALLVSLACHNATTRVMYAMGRDGSLPRALGRTHAKHKTPHIAIRIDLIVALLLGGIVGFTSGPATVYGFFAGTGSIGVILIYLFRGIRIGYVWIRLAYPSCTLQSHAVRHFVVYSIYRYRWALRLVCTRRNLNRIGGVPVGILLLEFAVREW
ncbi:MAG: amino acid permease [Bacilli bacterium]